MIRTTSTFLAFTLAEVLITLAIIGIVAAITIPSLIKNIQLMQYKSSYKKEYSILSQAMTSIANDNGGSNVGVYSSNSGIRDAFAAKLKTLKKCEDAASKGVCWATTTSYMDGTIKTDMWSTASTVLNDGSSIMFYYPFTNCDSSAFGLPNGETTCGILTIDVNGLTGPNKFGYDIYILHILNNRVLPYGFQNDPWQTYSCPGKGWDSGLSCSAKYLYQ